MVKQDVQLLEVGLDLIRKLDSNGPRYASYPTADRFTKAFDAEPIARGRQGTMPAAFGVTSFRH